MPLKILLVVVGFHGFALTLLMQKPPGVFFLACSILMIAVLGPVLLDDKRPGPLKIIGAMIVATAAQQFIIGFLAPGTSRVWLTLQFLALQTLLIGAMLSPKSNNG